MLVKLFLVLQWDKFLPRIFWPAWVYTCTCSHEMRMSYKCHTIEGVGIEFIWTVKCRIHLHIYNHHYNLCIKYSNILFHQINSNLKQIWNEYICIFYMTCIYWFGLAGLYWILSNYALPHLYRYDLVWLTGNLSILNTLFI